MQPVLYSCTDAEEGDPGWIRTGSDICYYKNHYKRSCLNPKTEREKYFYTLTFTIQFPHSNDSCYLAYHYPYSFSLLEVSLNVLVTQHSKKKVESVYTYARITVESCWPLQLESTFCYTGRCFEVFKRS